MARLHIPIKSKQNPLSSYRASNIFQIMFFSCRRDFEHEVKIIEMNWRVKITDLAKNMNRIRSSVPSYRLNNILGRTDSMNHAWILLYA